jgi:hypothetical protein
MPTVAYGASINGANVSVAYRVCHTPARSYLYLASSFYS